MEPKESSQNLPKIPPPHEGISLLRLSTVVYAIMGAIGFMVCRYLHKDIATTLAIPADREVWIHLLTIGGLASGILLVFGRLFEEWFPSYRAIKSTFLQILGRVSIFGAIYLALLSSFGEELLFRGAIQPYAGLYVTAFLFGILHMGPDAKFSAWTLWAIIAGVLLGWLYQETQSLWPSIITHFIVNCTSLLILRAGYKKQMKQLQESEAAKSQTSSSSDNT